MQYQQPSTKSTRCIGVKGAKLSAQKDRKFFFSPGRIVVGILVDNVLYWLNDNNS